MNKITKYSLLFTLIWVSNKSFGAEIFKENPDVYLKILNDTKDNLVIIDKDDKVLTGLKVNSKKKINISKYIEKKQIGKDRIGYYIKLKIINPNDQKIYYSFAFSVTVSKQVKKLAYLRINLLEYINEKAHTITENTELIDLPEDYDNILGLQIELILKGDNLQDSILDFTGSVK